MIGQGQSLMKEAVLLVSLLGALQACSGFPHIVVLHDPLTPQEHVTLGESYQAQGNTELAVREFQAALRRQRDYVPALIALGNLSFEAGTLPEAEDYYRQALAAVPDDPAASNNLAMVYVSQGNQLNEAERLAKGALAKGGALRPYVLDTLAKVYMRQERYQEARTALEEAVAAAPSENKLLHERLAQSQRELAAVASIRSSP